MSIVRLLAVLCLWVLLPGAVQAQRFSLEVPGNPAVKSTAVLQNNTLTIIDGQGQQFVYARFPRLDDPDGGYVAYFSQEARQYIRWPVNDVGSFLITSNPQGNWRASQMQIQARAMVRPNPNPLNPNLNPLDPLDPNPLPGNRGPAFNGPIYPAVLQTARNNLSAAYITPEGKLHFASGWEDEWLHQEFNMNLVPGAPVSLVASPQSQMPLVYTVNNNGELLEISDGEVPRVVSRQPTFPPGSNLVSAQLNNQQALFAVDSQGRLWGLDALGRQHQLIDQSRDRFLPGSPVTFIEQPEPQLFLVDRSGSLIEYTFANGQWFGPSLLEQGWLPGSHVAAAVSQGFGQPVHHLALIDGRGRLTLMNETANGWQPVVYQEARFVPGGPLALSVNGNSLAVSAVTQDGNWGQFSLAAGGDWQQQVIAPGFSPGAPVQYFGPGDYGFAVDPSGRLLAGRWGGTRWNTHFLDPLFTRPPRLVSRRLVPGPAQAPASIFLSNSHSEELQVQIFDSGSVTGPAEIRIAPNASVKYEVPRSGGTVMEEIYEVFTPAGWVEKVRRFDVPATSTQTAVVYARRTTYTYIDRRKNKPKVRVPNFTRESPVSLGVFEIPPGDFLRDGEVIDVFRAASQNRNPGAAIHFPAPAP